MGRTSGCEACGRLPRVGLEALEVIGGSTLNAAPPWGELRKCRGCAAYFSYSIDHDNGPTSGPDTDSIRRLTAEGARKLAEDATVSAQGMLAHFAAKAEDPGERANLRARWLSCADDLRHQLQRLAAELVVLAARPGQ